MKKILITILILTFSLFTILWLYSKMAKGIPFKIEDESEIKDFINNYFSIRNSAVFDNNKINNLLSLYSDSNQKLKNHELERINFYKNWGHEWEWKLLDMKSCVYIEDLIYEKEEIRAKVYEWIMIKSKSKKLNLPNNFEELPEIKELRKIQKEKKELKEAIEDKIKYIIKGYTEYPEIVDTGIGVIHEMILKKENGEWRVYKDSYDEGPDLTRSPDFDVQSNEIKSNLNNQIIPLSSISYYYDREDGANYADQYVYHYTSCSGDQYFPNYYNTCYKNFNPYGGDCANYVSQCLHAGGQPRIFDDGTYPTGLNPWYYKNNGTCNTTSDDSWNTSWINADSLLHLIINSGRGEIESYSLLCIGDVAFWDEEPNGTMNHAVFVTVSGSGGNPDLMNSHTNDRYHCPIYQNSKWTYVWIYGGQQSINY
ncbi:MAG: amidase domain-containing protein [Caldisericia bacterium]|nr:amidase domain-containing protein [Caldisericia bacterium]